LGQCAETNAVAMAAYVIDLVAAMVDLVQIESVPLQALPGNNSKLPSSGAVGAPSGESDTADVKPKLNGSASGTDNGEKGRPSRKSGRNKATVEEDDEEEEKVERTMDSNPTDANPKYPPLRRAALHFLALLVRSTTARIYDLDDDGAFGLPDALMTKGSTVLNYVAATDRDEVVRVMARETAEEMDELRNAIYGI